MKILFHTNLDEAQRDVSNLNAFGFHNENSVIPRVKEYIVFPFEKWENDRSREFTFSLEVVGVRYNYFNSTVNVELHIPRIPSQSIAEWSEWFRKFR